MSGPPDDAAGAAVYALWTEVLSGFFKLRAAGRRMGAVDPSGGGTWGLLRSLATGGPQTVPDLARQRPVSRQHIQLLVNRLADAGLVELVENPAHRRSRLVSLTAAGRDRFGQIDAEVRAVAADLAAGLDPKALTAAAETLAEVNRRLEDRLDPSVC